MKKIIILFLSSFSTILFSQTVIWEEDFGGGFPAGWTTYTANTGVGNSGPFPGNTG